MSTDSTPTKYNKLDLRNQFKLLDWMRSHETLVVTESDTKIAALASLELNFKITGHNITGTRGALGLEKVKPDAPLSTEERLNRLAGELEVMKAGVSSMMTVIQKNALNGRLLISAKELQDLIGVSPQVSFSPVLSLGSSETLPGIETTVNEPQAPQQP